MKFHNLRSIKRRLPVATRSRDWTKKEARQTMIRNPSKATRETKVIWRTEVLRTMGSLSNKKIPPRILRTVCPFINSSSIDWKNCGNESEKSKPTNDGKKRKSWNISCRDRCSFLWMGTVFIRIYDCFFPNKILDANFGWKRERLSKHIAKPWALGRGQRITKCSW